MRVKTTMFPPELERDAFRATNGEFGWTREQIPPVVDILRSHGIGILGGELWWIREGASEWVGSIPQQHGPPGVYCWETKRRSGEPWAHFVDRGASDALAAIDRWPLSGDLPPDLTGKILYNLTWASEGEFEKLGVKAV
jgi:hypothetical protein